MNTIHQPFISPLLKPGENTVYLHTFSKEEQVAGLVEIELKKPDDFLIVKETLTRMGIGVDRNKTLYQSCHILQKRGKYYIVSYRECFGLDGREISMTKDDYLRRNLIIKILHDWKIIVVKDSKIFESVNALTTDVKMNLITIITHQQKKEWTTVPKYKIGKK